jgi:hypothetical protein
MSRWLGVVSHRPGRVLVRDASRVELSRTTRGDTLNSIRAARLARTTPRIR